MIVAVFGSANPKPGDSLYQEAQILGELLAKSGHAVMTGGYCGTMEAISRGAAEAGGQTIGVTCRQIEDFRPMGANPWVKEIRRTDTLDERIQILTTQADAYIGLPGGVGTLVELAMVYNKMIIGSIPSKKLILIGNGWKDTFEAFFAGQAENLDEKIVNLPHFAHDPDQAIEILNKLNSGD
jgi:uncharacterized protein (TIGR00730 family)